MAIEHLYPASLLALFEFICNPANDVDHMWIYQNGIYLGSLLPKENKTTYQNEELTMLLYIKEGGEPCWEQPARERTIVLTTVENYSFSYV
jgi:hypothetical protein